MGPDNLDVLELQLQVGVSEELTDRVLSQVGSCQPSPALLPVYNLLMLERYEATIPLIMRVVEAHYDLEYLTSLQKSRFYLQRRSVPCLAATAPCSDRKMIFKASLRDPICVVVKEAVGAIMLNSPFTKSEHLDIAKDLFNSKYMAVRVLSVDVLALAEPGSQLLAEILASSSWRMRLRAAALLRGFGGVDQQRIISALIHDHIEEIRIHLGKSLDTLDHAELLKDPSEHVRAAYLYNVVHLIDDRTVFDALARDPSWEVKKVLLNLTGEWFKQVTIPLIKVGAENTKWRVRLEILGLIDEHVENDFASRLLISFIIKRLQDKISAIRTKAKDILLKMLERYDWCAAHVREIEDVVRSENYLYRVSVVPVAISYDRKFGTQISEVLQKDRVENVRQCYYDYAHGEDGASNRKIEELSR